VQKYFLPIQISKIAPSRDCLSKKIEKDNNLYIFAIIALLAIAAGTIVFVLNRKRNNLIELEK